jgi:DNA repair exonuclease SbcCD ATPase subunit
VKYLIDSLGKPGGMNEYLKNLIGHKLHEMDRQLKDSGRYGEMNKILVTACFDYKAAISNLKGAQKEVEDLTNQLQKCKNDLEQANDALTKCRNSAVSNNMPLSHE